MWLVKTLILEDDPNSLGIPFQALLVMSTKKLYVLRIIAEASDDMGSWLKKTITSAIDRIDDIRLICAKVGISFRLRSKTNVHALLDDQNVTDRLRQHIMTSSKLFIYFVSSFHRSLHNFRSNSQNRAITAEELNGKVDEDHAAK